MWTGFGPWWEAKTRSFPLYTPVSRTEQLVLLPSPSAISCLFWPLGLSALLGPEEARVRVSSLAGIAAREWVCR